MFKGYEGTGIHIPTVTDSRLEKAVLRSTLVFALALAICVSAIAQSNVVCTADVPSTTCKTYSMFMDWSTIPWVKNVQIVVADPNSFTLESKKLVEMIDNRRKAARTVGDMNKAANLQVGDGLFTNVIFETNRGTIEKVVISTDRTTTIKGTDGKDIVIPDSGGIEKLADELVFYLMGYAEGNLRGVVSTVP